MKRVLSLFLSCIFVLGVCFSTPIVASATEANILEFTSASGNVFQYVEGSHECSVKEWRGSGGDLTLTDVQYNETTYTITGILSGAFSGCTDLETLTIKSNIKTIEAGAFVGCTALTAFIESTESENEYFEVVDGVLFNENQTALIAYPAAKTGTEYTIPEGVEEIADGAFANCTSINAFSVSVDTYFSTTEDGILFNANKTKLIAYPAGKTDVTTYTIPATVTEIADGAFSGCKSLETITVAEGNTAFSATDDGVLFNKEETNLVAYPAGKTGETYTIPTTVTEIADGAFSGANVYLFSENSDGSNISGSENLKIHYGYNSEKGYKHNYVDAVCTVCELVCEHTWIDGKCEVCEKACEHTWENDACTECGIVAQHVHSWSFDVVEDENGNKISATCESCPDFTEGVTITLEAPEIPDDATSLIYDGSVKKATVTDDSEENIFENTKITYKSKSVNEDDEVVYTALEGEDLPTNAGTYRASITLGEETVSVEFTIEKAAATFTAPTANTELTAYSGQPQPLVIAGTTTGGTMQYKIGETGDWSTEIPTGTNATTYTVQYQFVVDDNYAYTGEETQGSVTVTIAPKTITATIEPIADQIYTGSAIEPTVVVKDGETVLSAGTDYVVIYSANTNVGTATVSVTLKGNYSGTATATFKIVEHVHSWNFDAVDGEGNENKIKATCEGAGSCIYQTEGVTITLEAPKAPAGETSLVYDGSEKVATVTISAENTGITPDVVYTSKTEGVQLVEGKCINAGDYTVSITLLGKDENETIVTVSFTIEKATATFTVPTANTELTYSGQPQALVTAGTTTGGTMQYKLGEAGEWSTNIPTGTDAGDYTVYYKFIVDDNYAYTGENATTGICEVTIAPHEHSWTYLGDGSTNTITARCINCPLGNTYVTLTLIMPIPEVLVYNNEAKSVSVYVSDENANVIVPQPIYTYNGEEIDECKNAGDYKATITIGEAKASIDFTITKATLKATDIPLVMPENPVYNGGPQSVTIEDSGKISAENITVKYYKVLENGETESLDSAPINAGTYKVKVDVTGEDNYVDVTDLTCDEWQFTIAKKELSEIYIGGINSETYTGLPLTPKVNIAIPGTDGGQPVTLAPEEYEVTYENNINAGEATVKITLIGNYTYSNIEGLTKTFTINKATPTIDNFTVTLPENLNYDGGAKTATVVVKDGVTGMGDVTVKYYDSKGNEVTPKSEGTYIVKIDVADGDNYESATLESAKWTFTIKEHVHSWQYSASGAVITATCQSAGCDIDETIELQINVPTSDYLVYNGEAKQVTYTITEGYEELFDEATISYIGDCVDAGNYTAYVEIGDATARLSFEISKAVIVVTKVTAIDRVYDGNLVVSINKTDGIVYTGLIDGDKVGFDLSALTGTLSDANVGSNKTVKVNGSIVLTGEDAKNYDVSTPGVTNVNITPATVTITPDAKTSEQYYGLPALTYKVTGFIGVDTLTKAPTLTTNADIKKTGDYTITAAGAEASANYVIKYATAPLTITAHKNHIVKDGTWKETVHGTCMVAGKEAGTCTLCGGTITRDSKTDPNNHTLITTVTKFQTCTQNGEALVTCANGCKYSLKTAVPADGKSHNFAKDFTVIESTCVAKGSKFKVCENEGCKVVTEKTEIAINPAAHKNIVTINAKDATCEEKGYTGDKFCNDCKKTIDPGIEINAKGHTESDWIVDKEATFTEEGAKHTACTVCKKELKKEVIAKRALETPKVKIENVSNGIKVSWSQDEDAAGYTVYSSIYNASTKKWSAWKNRGTAAANRSSWTDKTVTEGVTYRYTVRAVNGSNRSAYKATAGLLYVSAPKVTVTISSTGLLAKWNKVNNATGYIVYRRALVNGVWSSWVNLGTTAPEKNSWFDSNVQSGVSYRYTVRAVVNKVRGGYIASSAVIYLAQPLLNISNATAGVAGKWEPIAGATGYTIYRSEYNPSTKKWTKWLTLGTTGATAKTFTDKTVKSGYQYKYTIRAVNGKFRSTYQDSNKLVYLAQPTLKISNVANGIQGSWNQVNGATGYIIYRRELKDGKWSSWTSLGTTKATAKTFTDKTVKSGVTYRYTVRATNGVDRSSYASTGSLVFLSVPKVKISSGITGVNVSWSKIDGATSYLVYRREIANGKWTGWSRITTVTETSFVDETAKSGTYYRYTVRALNGKSSSKYTSTSTLYYLATPIVTVAKIDDGIKVNWTQVTGVTGYTIYRAQLGTDGKWSKWVTLGTATDKYSSCKDKTAKTGVTYKYTVRAVNGKVRSAYIDGAQIVNTVQ